MTAVPQPEHPLSLLAQVGRDSERSGLETFEKYQYQAAVAFTWCLHLVRDDEKSQKSLLLIVPEAHEDFSATWRDKKDSSTSLELVQIKAVEAPPSNASGVVESYGLKGLFGRWQQTTAKTVRVTYTLVTPTPIPFLTNTLNQWRKYRASSTKPEKTPRAITGLVEQVAGTLSKDSCDQVFKFLDELKLEQSFPRPDHIHDWNIGKLYHLRRTQRKQLDGIPEEYAGCRAALEKAFGQTNADPDYTRLGERLDDAAKWLMELNSRALEADKILVLLAGGTMPADWSELKRNARQEMAVERLFQWLLDQKDLLEQQQSPGEQTWETGSIAPYRIYLSQENDLRLDGLIKLLSSAQQVNTKQQSLQLFIDELSNHVRPQPQGPYNPGPRKKSINYSGVENLPEEQQAPFLEAVKWLEPRLTQTILSSDALKALVVLIKIGDSEFRNQCSVSVADTKQCRARFHIPLGRLKVLAGELAHKEVGLAAYDDEEAKFHTIRHTDQPEWSFIREIEGWEGLIGNLELHIQ